MSDSHIWSELELSPGTVPAAGLPPADKTAGFAEPTNQQHFMQPVVTTQPGVYPQAPQAFYASQAVHVQVMNPNLRGDPVRMTCPHCRKDMTTTVTYETAMLTHLAACGLCVFGCICCFYIPYYVDAVKNACHDCSECGKSIGIYRRL